MLSDDDAVNVVDVPDKVAPDVGTVKETVGGVRSGAAPRSTLLTAEYVVPAAVTVRMR